METLKVEFSRLVKQITNKPQLLAGKMAHRYGVEHAITRTLRTLVESWAWQCVSAVPAVEGEDRRPCGAC